MDKSKQVNTIYCIKKHNMLRQVFDHEIWEFGTKFAVQRFYWKNTFCHVFTDGILNEVQLVMLNYATLVACITAFVVLTSLPLNYFRFRYFRISVYLDELLNYSTVI